MQNPVACFPKPQRGDIVQPGGVSPRSQPNAATSQAPTGRHRTAWWREPQVPTKRRHIPKPQRGDIVQPGGVSPRSRPNAATSQAPTGRHRTAWRREPQVPTKRRHIPSPNGAAPGSGEDPPPAGPLSQCSANLVENGSRKKGQNIVNNTIELRWQFLVAYAISFCYHRRTPSLCSDSIMPIEVAENLLHPKQSSNPSTKWQKVAILRGPSSIRTLV